MAFWGVEIKPGKPFPHVFDKSRGRLHISQATLGDGKSEKKSLVQCNVGDKSPVLLCCLMPDKMESCSLDIEFEEDEEVVLSVLGPRSVHLVGYYLGNDGHSCEHDDDSDSYGEDIAETESEDDESMDFGSDDDEYEDDFIDDDDLETYSLSPKRKSGVVIEEILDDEKPANGKGDRRRLKKKYQMSDSDDGKSQQIVVKGRTAWSESESEDEDGLPISSHSMNKATDKSAGVEDKSEKKVPKGTKMAEDGGEQLTGSKRKMENVVEDGETERGVEQLKDSSVPSLEVQLESAEKQKKKKKKQKRSKEEKILEVGDAEEDKAGVEEAKTDSINQDQPIRDAADEKPNDKSLDIDSKSVGGEDEADGKKKKKKKKKKKNKTPDSDKKANIEEAKKGSIVENGDKKTAMKPSQARSYSNGLVVEELQMGKPDGKRASPGNRVFVHYIGKLKSNGKIFDSNTGKSPFKFRLGVGEVIKGWDVGVNGMRIGDKRRITVPPPMGYGSAGAGNAIPPNAWLVFDVELVNVR